MKKLRVFVNLVINSAFVLWWVNTGNFPMMLVNAIGVAGALSYILYKEE